MDYIVKLVYLKKLGSNVDYKKFKTIDEIIAISRFIRRYSAKDNG